MKIEETITLYDTTYCKIVNGNRIHIVVSDITGMVCSCVGFQKHRKCKHVRFVLDAYDNKSIQPKVK